MKLAIKIVIGLLIFVCVCVILPIIILKKDKNKYSCNTDGECVKDPQGTYTESTCNNECNNEYNNLIYGQTYLLKHVGTGKYLRTCGSLTSSDCTPHIGMCTPPAYPGGVGTLLGSPEDACATGKIKLFSSNDDKVVGQNVTSGESVILKLVDTDLNLRPCGHFYENSQVMVAGVNTPYGIKIETNSNAGPIKLTDTVSFSNGKYGYFDIYNYDSSDKNCICSGDILVMSKTKNSDFQFVPVNNICDTAP